MGAIGRPCYTDICGKTIRVITALQCTRWFLKWEKKDSLFIIKALALFHLIMYSWEGFLAMYLRQVFNKVFSYICTVRLRHKNQFSFSFRMHIFWPAIFFWVYLKNVLGMQNKPRNYSRETPSIYSQNSECIDNIQVTCSIASRHELWMYWACIFLVSFPRWKNKIAES